MTTKKNWKLKLALAAAMALAAGCHDAPKNAAYEEPSSDSSENNRLLIRMALEENVYTGVANERSVYPKDFRPATAELNPLGARRVDMLIDACRGARGNIHVLRGDEIEEVYVDRVKTVAAALADAGIDPAKVVVVQADHPNNRGVSSDPAWMNFDKFLSEYSPRNPEIGQVSESDSKTPGAGTTGTPGTPQPKGK